MILVLVVMVTVITVVTVIVVIFIVVSDSAVGISVMIRSGLALIIGFDIER
jgi:hypothetical protein